MPHPIKFRKSLPYLLHIPLYCVHKVPELEPGVNESINQLLSFHNINLDDLFRLFMTVLCIEKFYLCNTTQTLN